MPWTHLMLASLRAGMESGSVVYCTLVPNKIVVALYGDKTGFLGRGCLYFVRTLEM